MSPCRQSPGAWEEVQSQVHHSSRDRLRKETHLLLHSWHGCWEPPSPALEHTLTQGPSRADPVPNHHNPHVHQTASPKACTEMLQRPRTGEEFPQLAPCASASPCTWLEVSLSLDTGRETLALHRLQGLGRDKKSGKEIRGGEEEEAEEP